jgi:hypothetical protein
MAQKTEMNIRAIAEGKFTNSAVGKYGCSIGIHLSALVTID